VYIYLGWLDLLQGLFKVFKNNIILNGTLSELVDPYSKPESVYS
jgi:hypothetical protein